MAKRFTESRKWDDAWFIGLEIKYRFLWIYILDKCNHNGVYQSIPTLETFNLGHTYNWSEVEKNFADRIIKLPENCYFIPKFIKFQYSGLKKNTPLYLSIKQYLNDKNLLQYIKEDAVLNHSDGTVAVELPNSIGNGIGNVLGNGNGKRISKKKISDSEFIELLESNPAYCGISIDTELSKMDAWLLSHPGRKKTRKFIVNWLNRVDKPLQTVNPYENVK